MYLFCIFRKIISREFEFSLKEILRFFITHFSLVLLQIIIEYHEINENIIEYIKT